MRSQTKNLTVLFTDIKGFTEKTSRKSRAEIVEMLEEPKKIVLPILVDRGGTLIKTIGDAFLMVFDSPTDAVLAGIEVQKKLREFNEGKTGDERLDIRIAINTGEVTLAENDVFGEPVNIAARIEGVAVPGEVFFTEAVYLAMNKKEVPSSEVGLLQLKGISEKIRVYKVVDERRPKGLESPPLAPSEKARLVGAAAGKAALGRKVAGLALDLTFVMLAWAVLDPGRNSSGRVTWDPDSATRKESVKVLDGRIEVQGPDGLIRVDDADSDGGLPLLFPIMWALYGGLSVAVAGATPGQRLMKLKVAGPTGAKLSPGLAAVRAGASVLSLYAVGVGYAWGLFDQESRTLHDLIAGTRVVPSDS